MTQTQNASDRPKQKRRQKTSLMAMRRDNARLRERVAGLTALVDHYFGAYREAQSLLERRERELAELRQRLDSKPVALHRGRSVSL